MNHQQGHKLFKTTVGYLPDYNTSLMNSVIPKVRDGYPPTHRLLYVSFKLGKNSEEIV